MDALSRPVLLPNVISKDEDSNHTSDPFDDPILKYFLENNKTPSGLSKKQTKRLEKQQEHFLSIDGQILYRADKASPTYNHVVPPPNERRNLIADTNNSAHFKTDTVFNNLRERYFWPKKKTDIERFIKNCSACLAFDSQPETGHKALSLPCEPFMSRVGMDCVFELNEAKDGSKRMVVFTDYFTKWPEVFTIKNKTAAEIARKFKINKFFD